MITQTNWRYYTDNPSWLKHQRTHRPNWGLLLAVFGMFATWILIAFGLRALLAGIWG